MIATTPEAKPNVSPAKTLLVESAIETVVRSENIIATARPTIAQNVPTTIAHEVGFTPTTRLLFSDLAMKNLLMTLFSIFNIFVC